MAKKRTSARTAAEKAADAAKTSIMQARTERGIPASTAPKTKAKRKRSRRWRRDGGSDYTTEDSIIERYGGRTRIRDMGQKPPEGYSRGGGRYFVRNKYLRPIKSKTSEAAAAWVALNHSRLYGLDGEGKTGWLASAGKRGQYSSKESLVNFREVTAARKALDLAFPDKNVKRRPGQTAKESIYILDFGQDGHAR